MVVLFLAFVYSKVAQSAVALRVRPERRSQGGESAVAQLFGPKPWGGHGIVISELISAKFETACDPGLLQQTCRRYFVVAAPYGRACSTQRAR